MSNYSVNDIIGVRSTSVSGQINMISSNSPNGIQVQAPSTIASNVLFTLPNTTPQVTGEYLLTDGVGTLSWAAGVPLKTTFPINRRTYSNFNSTTPFITNSATPVIADYCELGKNVPVALYVVASASSSGLQINVRVRVITPASFTTFINYTSPTISTSVTPQLFFCGNMTNTTASETAEIAFGRGINAGQVNLFGYQFVPL